MMNKDHVRVTQSVGNVTVQIEGTLEDAQAYLQKTPGADGTAHYRQLDKVACKRPMLAADHTLPTQLLGYDGSGTDYINIMFFPHFNSFVGYSDHAVPIVCSPTLGGCITQLGGQGVQARPKERMGFPLTTPGPVSTAQANWVDLSKPLDAQLERFESQSTQNPNIRWFPAIGAYVSYDEAALALSTHLTYDMAVDHLHNYHQHLDSKMVESVVGKPDPQALQAINDSVAHLAGGWQAQPEDGKLYDTPNGKLPAPWDVKTQLSTQGAGEEWTRKMVDEMPCIRALDYDFRPVLMSEEGIFRGLLAATGDDAERPGLLETPARVMKAFQHWFSGYTVDVPALLKVFEDGAEGVDQMVIVKDIPIYSKCEHHMADIFGTASIAYIPNGKIVGLSKLSRVADAFARRLQVQERLTKQIADAIQEYLQPVGVGVVIKARHMCMESRGICQQGHHTVTSALHGVLRDDVAARAEFFSLVNSK